MSPPPDAGLPTVTIVVPVFNEAQRIARTLERLLDQDYPRDRYDVVVVDNGSVDDTVRLVGEFPVRLLHESQRSSYAARNRGITESAGDYVAFIDSDCVAERAWLRRLVSADLERGRGLVAGRIELDAPERPTFGSLVLRGRFSGETRRKAAEEEGAASGGNLLIRRVVFDEIGLFETLISGGDGKFSLTAARNGRRAIYAEDAVVWHPSEMTSVAFIRRAFRIAHGAGCLARKAGKGFGDLLRGNARSIVRGSVYRPWRDKAARRRSIEEVWGHPMSHARYALFIGYLWLAFGAAMIGQFWGFLRLPYSGDR